MKNSKKEIWKDIPGYEGYYQVSNLGRIRSLDRWVIFKNGRKQFYKGRFFEGSLNVHGYKQVTLSKDGKQIIFRIHQLVAVCYLGHTPDGHTLVVDHINGDKIDNRAQNLQIVSQRDNTSTCFRKDRNSFSSNFAGVSYHKQNDKWQAHIHFKGKKNNLGLFDSEINASNIYQKALGEINDGTFKIEDYKVKWTSKYKGISYYKSTQKWLCYPSINGKRIYLGYHSSEEEAYQAILEFEAIQPIVKNC